MLKVAILIGSFRLIKEEYALRPNVDRVTLQALPRTVLW
jgi:hypothetical protein